MKMKTIHLVIIALNNSRSSLFNSEGLHEPELNQTVLINIDLFSLLYHFNATPNRSGFLRLVFAADDATNCSGFSNLLQSFRLLSVKGQVFRNDGL